MTDLDSTLWSEALTRMTARVWTTMEMPLDGFPHYGDPETGAWTTTPDAFWTGGFWVGELWLAAHYSGDNRFAEAAEEWLHRLAARVDSSSVFRGFLFYYGAVPGAELARSDPARDLAIRAARSLASTFNPTAGLLPLGAAAEEAHTVGDDESNIDGLIASPLLLWAAKESGDAELRRIALSHAARNAELCVQADGSVIQSASFDPATGKVTRRYTHKGYAEDSVWTRAQAWAMLGYVLSARLAPDEPGLLAHAERTADWWLANIPGDLVAYWDFSAPRTPETRRDTSGTAIAAAALLKLGALHPDRERAERYAGAARRTVQALVRGHLTPVSAEDRRPAGSLADGCFDPNNGTAVANELIWGDYFLFEALGVLAGRLRSRAL